MLYTVALTGGIGSGKSTVANAFMKLGVTVIDTDTISKQIVKPGTLALRTIIDYFGTKIINTNGTLNRSLLREYIFLYPDKKDWLNNLLHPMIYQESKRQMAQINSSYVLWVVPLLIEKRLHREANFVLVVDVKPEIQIKRTMKRDNVSREHVKRIMSAQIEREARLAVADAVIDNSGPLSSVIEDVKNLHIQYLSWCKVINF